MKTIGIVGCGNLGSAIAQGVADKLSCYYKIVAVFDSTAVAANALAESCMCASCTGLGELLSHNPDFVIEAASPIVLKKIALEVLHSNSNLMPLSVGALEDDEFFGKLKETAEVTGKKVYLVSGAIGGLDLMRASTFAGDVKAQIVTKKLPASFAGAPGLAGQILPESKVSTIFEGTAREAITAFPKNVNVAVALGICTAGVENTLVKIISDPSIACNVHSIELSGDFGEANIVISAKPSPDNPSSSRIAAMSVLARLESLANPISYF